MYGESQHCTEVRGLKNAKVFDMHFNLLVFYSSTQFLP